MKTAWTCRLPDASIILHVHHLWHGDTKFGTACICVPLACKSTLRLQASASRTIAMLFIGRILWGIGVGFGDHCAFIYTSEMAPPRWRGRLNTLVQCGTITGIVIASAINIGTSRIVWGWRISLALAAVPGSILLLGAVPDPCSSGLLDTAECWHHECIRLTAQLVEYHEHACIGCAAIEVADLAVRFCHTHNTLHTMHITV
jgi:MFS family permease